VAAPGVNYRSTWLSSSSLAWSAAFCGTWPELCGLGAGKTVASVERGSPFAGVVKNPASAPPWEIPLLALLLLCFFQLLTDFIASVYAIGLLQVSVPSEIAYVILVFAPVTLLVFRRATAGFVVLTGQFMLLGRLVSLGLDTRGKMLAAGLGTAAFLVFFPALLWRRANQPDRRGGSSLGVALALATLLQVFLGAISAGNDITGFGAWRCLGGGIALAAGLLLWVWGRHPKETTAAMPQTSSAAGVWRIAGLCVGMVGVWVTLYFGLANPAVIAHWMNGGCGWITTLSAGAAGVFVLLGLGGAAPRWRAAHGALLGWNLLFLAALGLTLWSSRVPFPADARAYPFPEPSIGFLGRLSLPLLLLLSPVLYVNFARYAGAVVEAAPSMRTLGAGFMLGSFCILLLVFAQVFSTVYDYIPVIGSWFRDRFWWAGLAAGVTAVLPAFLLQPKLRSVAHEPATASSAPLMAAGAALALGAIGAVTRDLAQPRPPSAQALRRVMTFNLQQGYSAAGARNFTGQLALIRQANPDIVGLQETDTARVAGGNSDLVRFLAKRLNFYAHAGPRTGGGTFGVALLSRFPIARARVYYLSSTGEQTAVLAADLDVDGTTHHVFVTHLGNAGPIVQQREILELLAGKTNVFLMGDFNFRPDTESYRLTVERLKDAWLAAGERRADPPNQNPDHRIDHVFVSPDIPVRRAEYLGPGASDHPAMVVEVR
jgi:endonuclease/exonuclease/phosphatase family metal-dependent hydrolase